MKSSIKVFCLVFAVAMFTNLFTSCKKDPVIDPVDKTETPTENPTENQVEINKSQVSKLMSFTGDDDFQLGDSTDFCDCFDIFDGIDWDASENEIEAQLTAIFLSLTEDEIEALFTPVCTPNGEIYINACVATCNDITVFEECEFDEIEIEWEECFEFVYPLTIVLPNEPNVTVNSDEELIDVIDAWYDANDNSNEDVSLEYPVQVIMDGGATVTVNSDDELENLFDDCDENATNECFTFNFPLTILFPDSTTLDINSIDEGEAAVEAWEDANPNNNEDVTIVFPIQVTLEDDTVQTINNEDELEDLFEVCDFDFCFTEGETSTLKRRVTKTTK